MTMFYLALSLCINIFFIICIVFLHQEKEYWHSKFEDAIEELCPIKWDYTRKDGWIDDDKRVED